MRELTLYAVYKKLEMPGTGIMPQAAVYGSNWLELIVKIFKHNELYLDPTATTLNEAVMYELL